MIVNSEIYTVVKPVERIVVGTQLVKYVKIQQIIVLLLIIKVIKYVKMEGDIVLMGLMDVSYKYYIKSYLVTLP